MKYARVMDEIGMEGANTEPNCPKNGDCLRSGKIQTGLDTVEKLSMPPAEIEFRESLLTKTDETEVGRHARENPRGGNRRIQGSAGFTDKELEQTPDTEPGMSDRIND